MIKREERDDNKVISVRDISPLGKAVILKLDRGLGCWHTVTDTDVRA